MKVPAPKGERAPMFPFWPPYGGVPLWRREQTFPRQMGNVPDQPYLRPSRAASRQASGRATPSSPKVVRLGPLQRRDPRGLHLQPK